MASTEVVEIHSDSSDDEFEEPHRKPIGWNYQLSTPKASKAKLIPNGATTTASCHQAKEESATQSSSSSATLVIHHPRKEASPAPADDDLEIIEVKVEPKKKIPLLPSSSSRSEIRKQVRSTTQSSISNFFTSRKKTVEDTNGNDKTPKPASNPTDKGKMKKESGDEKEEEEEEEEENDKSTAKIEEFMRRWEEIKISKDDDKIRDKIWKHYHLAQTSYTHSKKFIQIVETSTRKLTVDNIYVVIKDILDCLKQYKDTPYKEKGSEEESAGTSREATPAPIETGDNKINSKLKKVDKMMKELAEKIKKMENDEVDLDDDDNSAYLVEDRLKRQFAKLHDYYCRLANCSPAIGRPIERKFKYRGSKWMEINKRITAWVNKHKEFPDYVDILNLVKKVTKQTGLPLRPETVRVEAQEIFRDVGRMLKDRRESDDLYSIYSYLEDDEDDPAINDEALNSKLNENEKIAAENLDKVFQEYVVKDAHQNNKTLTTPAQQDSSVKDPLRTAECQKEECNKTEGENNVKEDQSGESQVKMKNGSDNCIENDRNAENDDEEEEDTISDIEGDTASDNEGNSEEDDGTSNDDNGSSDNDDDSSIVEIEEDGRLDMKEQSAHEGVKEEEDLDDESDDTDDDLKVVLASACVEEEEEEEDSEEDVPVMNTEELLELEASSGESSSKNSVLCLNDDSQELATVISTSQDNCTEELSIITTAVAASPDASVDTATTTSSSVTSESPQKRKQEENLPPCKRLCI